MAEERNEIDKNFGFGEFVKNNVKNGISENSNWRRSSEEDKDDEHEGGKGYCQIDDGDKHRVYSPNETPGFPR